MGEVQVNLETSYFAVVKIIYNFPEKIQSFSFQNQHMMMKQFTNNGPFEKLTQIESLSPCAVLASLDNFLNNHSHLEI